MRNVIVASAAALLLATAAQAGLYRCWAAPPSPGLREWHQNPMDTGYNVGGRAGTSLDAGTADLSVEADGLFNQSTYSNPKMPGSVQFLYGKPDYHFTTGTPFSVYGGAGLGAVNTNIDSGVSSHGGSTVLGWQAWWVEYRASNRPACSPNIISGCLNVNAGGLTQVGNRSTTCRSA